MNEARRFLLLATLIGIFTGLLIVCFHIAIDTLSWQLRNVPLGRGKLLTALIPALGATISALMIRWIFPSAKGSGVNHTKAAIFVSDGHVAPSSVAGKFLACSLSIGSGNSLGPEDPSLQMGAGTASVLGRIFQLGRENMRAIAPVGAAAGIAAAFNTPITGVLFVIEEIIAGWRANVLGSIVLAAVSAVVVSRAFLGDTPLFEVPPFRLTHGSELLIYAAMGVTGGLLAALWVRCMRSLVSRKEHLPPWAGYALPFVAGASVGIIGWWLPEVMGAGYDGIDSALHQRFGVQMLIALALAKMLATALCFSAGTPGGMFAPSLFIGAMLGGAFGGLGRMFWPVPVSSGEMYVLVGMGTFFAGVFRAPMTSIFMVFEVSASYVVILPVMISNIIAYLISRSLQPEGFFDMLARLEGMDLPSSADRERPAKLVEEAMSAPAVPVFAYDQLAREVLEDLQTRGAAFGLVDLGAGRWSFVRTIDIENSAPGLKLREAFPATPIPRLYPDLSVDAALRAMGPHSVLPVVSRRNTSQLLGTLSLSDVSRSYGIPVTI